MTHTKTTPDASEKTQPRGASRPGSDFTSSQSRNDTQITTAAGEPNLPDSQSRTDIQIRRAVGDQATERGQAHLDAHSSYAALGPILADPVLGVLAEVVDDLESVRVANENRLRQLTDMGERGHGLTLQHPEIARLASIVAGLQASEHQAILNLKRVMRAHPLGRWAKPVAGVGEKQLARLLSVIGDPYWNDLHDRPRTVSELWAFCGYHVIHTSGGQPPGETHCTTAAGSNVHTSDQPAADIHDDFVAGVAPKRQRGQKSNWNEDARKRCYLIAESCIKQAKSPYRPVYDDTRTKYAEATHAEPCVRCGPKGKPAQPGSPLSLGHQHARAMRGVAKQLLKDLWRESKRIHEAPVNESDVAA